MRFLEKYPVVVLALVTLFVISTTAPSAYAYKYRLSSGLFLLPGNAASVDWAVLNNSQAVETVRVTVYEAVLGGAKTMVPPGSLEFTMNPGNSRHNANSVCNGCAFELGYYYEVVVETDNLNVLPTVTVWLDHSGTSIPGAAVLSADFVISEIPQAEEIILDNLPPGQRDASHMFSGVWCKSTAAGSYGADSLYSCGTSQTYGDYYTWKPTIVVAGNYNVYVRWTAHVNRSPNVPFFVVHAGGTTSKTYDQRTGGGVWVLHGTYYFNAGTNGLVQVAEPTVNGQACADAVRFEPVP